MNLGRLSSDTIPISRIPRSTSQGCPQSSSYSRMSQNGTVHFDKILFTFFIKRADSVYAHGPDHHVQRSLKCWSTAYKWSVLDNVKKMARKDSGRERGRGRENGNSGHMSTSPDTVHHHLANDDDNGTWTYLEQSWLWIVAHTFVLCSTFNLSFGAVRERVYLNSRDVVKQ